MNELCLISLTDSYLKLTIKSGRYEEKPDFEKVIRHFNHTPLLLSAIKTNAIRRLH